MNKVHRENRTVLWNLCSKICDFWDLFIQGSWYSRYQKIIKALHKYVQGPYTKNSGFLIFFWPVCQNSHISKKKYYLMIFWLGFWCRIVRVNNRRYLVVIDFLIFKETFRKDFLARIVFLYPTSQRCLGFYISLKDYLHKNYVVFWIEKIRSTWKKKYGF